MPRTLLLLSRYDLDPRSYCCVGLCRALWLLVAARLFVCLSRLNVKEGVRSLLPRFGQVGLGISVFDHGGSTVGHTPWYVVYHCVPKCNDSIYQLSICKFSFCFGREGYAAFDQDVSKGTRGYFMAYHTSKYMASRQTLPPIAWNFVDV